MKRIDELYLDDENTSGNEHTLTAVLEDGTQATITFLGAIKLVDAQATIERVGADQA